MTNSKNLSENLPEVCPVAGHAELAWARQKSWVGVSERGYEVLGYDSGWEVENSKETDKGGGFGIILDEVGLTDGPYRDEWNKQLVCHDGKERERMRKPVERLLRPGRIAKLQETVRTLINGILDDIDDPSNVEFMSQFAERLPTQLFCSLISAPLELEGDIFRITSKINPPILTFDVAGVKASEAAYWEGLEIMRKYISARRDNLTDDFTSEIIRCEQEGLLRADEVEGLAMMLLIASMDNTMHQIGLTFGTMLEDRTRWEQVLAKPTLATKAAEETFRMCPRFNAIGRHAPQDLPIHSFTFPAGSWIQVQTRACGRDEAKFENPDDFRLDRPAARSLQFGSVNYSCLGATLARLEVVESIRIVSERFPNIRLSDKWEYEVGPLVTECKKLPVSLI